MRIVIVFLGLIAFFISLALTKQLIGWSHRTGRLDQPEGPGGRKRHGRGVPNTGGLAIFAAVTLPAVLGLLVINAVPADFWEGALAILGQFKGVVWNETPVIVGVLVTALILWIMGWIDDRRGLPPMLKLLIELALATGLAGACNLRIFTYMDELGPAHLGAVLSGIISVIWIVTLINAMNFLDNMDGLSAGVGAIISALYLFLLFLDPLGVHQWLEAALAALLLGALTGFLVFNWSPAKIFMGDGGSLVVGFLLAVLSVRTTYYNNLITMEGFLTLLTPLFLLAIPFYDLLSVILIRARQQRSIFQADRQHVSHRLLRRGYGERSAVLIVWFCTFLTGVCGLVFRELRGYAAWLMLLQAIGVLLLLTILSWEPKPQAADVIIEPRRE